ncbi:hypothetical protein [Nocardia shimofusensis]|uniref:hypothetical protein n=1 Tax=Nocardia shimofusensis TaxID=228596 RepID=UPI0012EE083E|nr:hypothetical protein [Nocardia shimofusensis]
MIRIRLWVAAFAAFDSRRANTPLSTMSAAISGVSVGFLRFQMIVAGQSGGLGKIFEKISPARFVITANEQTSQCKHP